MKRPLSTILAVCAIGASTAGCVSFTKHPETTADSERIAIYESEPPGHRPYTLVKSIWVTSGWSLALVPGYRSAADGATDFRNQAVALGGDAVTNFGCYRLDATIPLESNPKLICNGRIIKYSQ